LIVTQANIYLVDTGLEKAGTIKPIILELITDEGIAGIGEAGIGYGLGSNSVAVLVKEMIDIFVLGQNTNYITKIWQDIYYNSFWAKGGSPSFFSALSAIEIALWDIKGKEHNIPLYEIFGGKVREKVHIYANWSMAFPCHSPKDFAERASQVVSDGYDAVKFYPLNNIDQSNRVVFVPLGGPDEYTVKRCVNSIKAVRKEVGADVALAVDLCADAPIETMLRIGREIEDCHLLFMEEAVDAFDDEGYRRLAAALATPQAAGERISSLRAFRRLLETRSIGYLQPDPTLCGGMAEAVKICALAGSFGVEVALHNCGSPVSTAACLHLDLSIPNACIQEVFPYRPDIFYELVDHAPEKDVHNSYWSPNNRPGLGLNLQHKQIDPFLLFSCQ